MKGLEKGVDGRKTYDQYILRKVLVLCFLLGLLVLVVLTSLSVGSSGLSFKEVFKAFLGFPEDPLASTILWQVRMPRVFTGLLVGMSLALAGCVMQSVLRNPLASASTLGVSQGASFGAAVAIVYFQAGSQVGTMATQGITYTNPYTVVMLAFLGGMVTTLCILLFSRTTGMSPTVMILAGVALSAMFSGATTLIQYFSDDQMVASIVYWTFGNLGRAGPREITLIFWVLLISFGYFFYHRWNYNAMESGFHTAKSLGVPVDQLMMRSMLLATLLSATAIAFVGTISFIGLIAPHILRRFVGSDYRFLIPGSALMGGVLMLSSDILSRMVLAPAILPIGAITSFLGGPLFLYLILKQRKKG